MQRLIILHTLLIGTYLCRVNTYIKYGLDKDVCNPYGGTTPSGSAPVGVTHLSSPRLECDHMSIQHSLGRA